jgi:hypothetical protein
MYSCNTLFPKYFRWRIQLCTRETIFEFLLRWMYNLIFFFDNSIHIQVYKQVPKYIIIYNGVLPLDPKTLRSSAPSSSRYLNSNRSRKPVSAWNLHLQVLPLILKRKEFIDLLSHQYQYSKICIIERIGDISNKKKYFMSESRFII